MHKHFKVSDENTHHLIQHPGKLILFVAVFVTIILCVVILIQQDSKQNQEIIKQEEIKKESVQIENSYTDQVKIILQNYLDARSAEDFNCAQQVNSTVSQVLNLTVPIHLKEFHLELVVLLDKENANCETQSEDLDSEWQDFLDKYDWLNN
ncbi:hypothetical protein KKA66_03045 [Patescibacteria group bacterium]|nr:hypothetical protein [Patescibacteria group bacterium]